MKSTFYEWKITKFVFFLLISSSLSDPLYDNNADREAAAATFKSYMENKGYLVDKGEFQFWSPEDCEEEGGLKCFGNNPDSPYGVYSFHNDFEGEYTRDLNLDLERRLRIDEAVVFFGLTPPLAKYFGFTHYLGRRTFEEDEAVVFFGLTPPLAKYFGFTHYLGRRINKIRAGSTRKSSSLSDAINPMNIKVTGDGSYEASFNSDVCIVTTGDQNMFEAVKEGMQYAGVPPEVMNLQVLSSDTLNLGNDRTRDSITWLHRIMRFIDKDAGNAYMENPPVHLFRVSPKVPVDRALVVPYPLPDRMNRATGVGEIDLRSSVQGLEAVLRRLFHLRADISLFQAKSKPTATQGEQCLEDNANCKRDNPDAAYFANLPGYTLGQNDVFIIYGINHVKTGYAKYMSVTLYGLNGIAFASLNSEDDMEGTAAKFIPDSPNVDKLFAVVMARDCQNYANCLKIPYAGSKGLPAGIPPLMSVTLYGLNGIAFASLNSEDDMEGTAAKFIPDSPNVDKLFAFVMARDCQSYANCLRIPYAGSKGLPAWVPPLMLSRNILNPQTGTGADFEELVPTRLMFAKLPRIAPLYKNKTKNGEE
eukprot:CAMPEP_0194392896 /NCGR_PEP_ID=MMETSP0174-20130528/122994_1 /TAXON_ID=216777 /ORGANISM="Proboscia alata, Strain PI-D3" /LENGTH=588 /DNA_ID=CAMNT_0039188515 /DNA_START=97 /DNA_END=1864 /DNA_ORIENTATION=+